VRSIGSKQYSVALSQMNVLQSTEASNPAMFKFTRALAESKKKAEDGMAEEQRQNRIYFQSDEFNKHWTLSIRSCPHWNRFCK
jgi:hypothetical protein